MLECLIGKTLIEVEEDSGGGFTLHFEDGYHVIGTVFSCGTCHVMRDGKLVPLLEAIENER